MAQTEAGCVQKPHRICSAQNRGSNQVKRQMDYLLTAGSKIGSVQLFQSSFYSSVAVTKCKTSSWIIFAQMMSEVFFAPKQKLNQLMTRKIKNEQKHIEIEPNLGVTALEISHCSLEISHYLHNIRGS